MNQRLLLTLALVGAAVLVAAMLWSREPGERPDSAAAASVTKEARAELASETQYARKPAPAADEKSQKVARYNELKARLQTASKARQELEKRALIGSVSDEAMPRPVGFLQKDYIQKQMQEIVPLIKECYDMALESEPELGGKVVVQWTIIGEPEIGGLVESSEVVPEMSDITSPDFLLCVQESIYAIELEAPEGGGTVTVKYPLVFATSDDE